MAGAVTSGAAGSTPGLALPNDYRHGPSEAPTCQHGAWVALAGVAFAWVVRERSERLMRLNTGGCLSSGMSPPGRAAAARGEAGGVPYLVETAIAPWAMRVHCGLTYCLHFVMCPWEDK